MEIDAQHVIDALRQQNADLAYRLALAEAQLRTVTSGDGPTLRGVDDGEAG